MATTTVTKKFIPYTQVQPSMIKPGELSLNAARRLAACFEAEPYLETGSGEWWAWDDEIKEGTQILDGEIRLNQALALRLHVFRMN